MCLYIYRHRYNTTCLQLRHHKKKKNNCATCMQHHFLKLLVSSSELGSRGHEDINTSMLAVTHRTDQQHTEQLFQVLKKKQKRNNRKKVEEKGENLKQMPSTVQSMREKQKSKGKNANILTNLKPQDRLYSRVLIFFFNQSTYFTFLILYLLKCFGYHNHYQISLLHTDRITQTPQASQVPLSLKEEATPGLWHSYL